MAGVTVILDDLQAIIYPFIYCVFSEIAAYCEQLPILIITIIFKPTGGYLMKFHSVTLSSRILLAVASVITLAAPAALSQGLEEVLVTAQKREQ